jgi:hypothetical protein
VDWFPRAFGLMLVVLAATFVLDLLRTEPWQPSPAFELCGGCIYANQHPPHPDGEIHKRDFCDLSPPNRICPQCGHGWHSSSPTLRELVDEPGGRALLAAIAGVALSIPLFSCPACGGRRRLTRRGKTSALRSCLRCEDRGLLGAWSRLFQG